MAVVIRDDILQSVEKPARYTGGELNSVVKDPAEAEIRFAFCFPEVYEVGMSHLGLRYCMACSTSGTIHTVKGFCTVDRCGARMRENGLPLFRLRHAARSANSI